MKLADFDYKLPAELIAKTPSKVRDHSRLMIVNRDDGTIRHDLFYNLPRYIKSDDLLVFNDTKVFPARLIGHKETGGKVEVLLTKAVGDGKWEFLGRNIGRADKVIFDQGLTGVIQNSLITFNIDNADLMRLISIIGYTPLPPYIDMGDQGRDPELRRRYQTVYARDEGSVAAPTAGFHFTPEVLSKFPNKAFVTLHVGVGTFAPVKSEQIEDHTMHSERYLIPQETVSKVEDWNKEGKRVIAVGTTSVRTLETWATTHKSEGDTNIFIYPGYEFNLVGGMITNFHLPKSTLLMLVSAFAGRDVIMKAYNEAIKERYRFYSFGDAMVIL